MKSSLNRDVFLIHSKLPACQGNPGAERKQEVSVLHISMHLFRKF